MARDRTLRSRLFSWFVGAILLAIATSALVVFTTSPEPVTGPEAMARHVAAHLAAVWDDPEAAAAYAGEVRDVTGFEARLVRDPRRLPARVRRVAERGGVLVPGGPQDLFVPVMRGGALVGALEMQRLVPRRAPWAWWRFGLGLFLVVAFLSAMAGGVANQLARPLERLADAADRFGGGDLGFRTDVGGEGRRWVAREVRDVAVSFNRMAEKVEALVRGQRELLGAISHELRSPLGRARVALEIARDRLPGEERARTSAALDDVEKQLGAVDAILADLLDVTRAGLADLRKESRPFVAWLRARVADEPTPPPIEVHVAAGADGVVLAFDPALLARAVHNLLVNARAHGHPPDRPIEVRVTREGAMLRVVVRDRGPGFPEGLADKAFEPFVRGDASRARPSAGPGHGLGLAIVRRVVEAHGGRAFARSADREAAGEGTGETLGEGPGETAGERAAAGAGAAAGEGAGPGAEVGFELPVAGRSG